MQPATTSPRFVRRSMPEVCELCEAARMTEWFYEYETCWIAECEQCYVPMVVWRQHDPAPPADVRDLMLERLGDVAQPAGLLGAARRIGPWVEVHQDGVATKRSQILFLVVLVHQGKLGCRSTGSEHEAMLPRR